MRIHVGKACLGIIVLAALLMSGLAVSAADGAWRTALAAALFQTGTLIEESSEPFGEFEDEKAGRLSVSAVIVYSPGREPVKGLSVSVWPRGKSASKISYIDFEEIPGLSIALGAFSERAMSPAKMIGDSLYYFTKDGMMILMLCSKDVGFVGASVGNQAGSYVLKISQLKELQGFVDAAYEYLKSH